MRGARPSPRERIVRIFEGVRKLEHRLTAKLLKMPPEDRPAFEARGIAKVNAIMKKAVLACSRVIAKQKSRRTRRTR